MTARESFEVSYSNQKTPAIAGSLFTGRSARLAVDEIIDSIGRQTIEAILNLSAEQIAGSRTPGKSSGDIRWHGSQKGRVSLADRQIKVKRPRLRHKEAGEVRVPAYESLQENSATAQRMIGALLRGVSTREYAEVLPAMAETAGVSPQQREPAGDRRQRRAITAVCWTRFYRAACWRSADSVVGQSMKTSITALARSSANRRVLDSRDLSCADSLTRWKHPAAAAKI